MVRQATTSKNHRHGFTLVELLIVIVAMAILAGIVIPQVGQSVEDANQSAMLTDLHQLTMAIERYKIDHDGLPPDDLTGSTLPQLINKTDVDGNIGSGPNYPYGPYLVEDIPDNPLNRSRTVQECLTVPPADLGNQTGWLYHPPSGQIWAGEKRS
jgi:prepilin-type N-terminal cleavage/methylation domain-containing protein